MPKWPKEKWYFGQMTNNIVTMTKDVGDIAVSPKKYTPISSQSYTHFFWLLYMKYTTTREVLG